MSIGFSSAARNLFLLGSTGAAVVTNFFKAIDQSAGTDGVYLPDEIKYNFVDQKFVLAGSADDSNSKGFGWLEKRDQAGTADFENRIESTQSGINTTLRAMELDSNDNLIVVGKTADIPWIAKYSNGGVIDWQSTTNSGDVEYTGVTSDSNGQYYACGNTPTSGEAQAFVEKFDASGNPGWGKSAFMLGRDVVLNRIAANARGEVVAVGYLEDDIYNKGYIIKIDTNTGEVLWDRTLSPDWQGDMLNCSDVYIDSNDQIYVTVNGTFVGSLIKYTAEGNMIWQKTTDDPSSTITFDRVKSDGETEQTVVFGTYDDGSGDVRGVLSKYSKDGSLVWRRTLLSTYNNSDTFSDVCLDADPSFYYLLFVDDAVDGFAGTPDRYTFGKVSSSGNGLGAFSYSPDAFDSLDYLILSVGDKIGRLSDGSVRQDTSDLITYPFNANKLLFDDLATQVSNKKRQMDSADSFEYSGNPAIRPADFQELNLLGDVYSGSGNWLDQSGKGNDGIVPGIWIKTLGSNDSSYASTIDNNYYYSAGMVQSEGQGNRDAYISKWNFNGSLAWQKIIGGTDLDQATDVVVDSNGNVYLIGNTKSIVSGQFNILIVKLDSNGSQVWQKIYGSSTNNMLPLGGSRIDYSGNIIVAIRDGVGATATHYTMKIDADGNIIWQYTYSIPIVVSILNSDNSFYSLTSYPGDNTYGLTLVDSNGSIVSQLSFGINYPVILFKVLRRPNGNFVFLGREFDNSVSPVTSTLVLVEYDSQLNPINNKTYIETSIGFHYANNAVLDSKGNLYATGLRYDSSVGPATYEPLAFKFNTDLEIEWAVTLGGNSNGLDLAYDIEISPDEKHIYITGFWLTNGTGKHNHFKIRTDNGISPGTYGSVIVGNHSYSGPTTNTQTFTSGNLITNTTTKSASSFSVSNSSLTLANSTLPITTELDTDPIYNAAGYWEFDGVNDYISGNSTPLANTTEGTIEAWIKTTSTANPGGHIYGESLPGTSTYWAHFRLNGSVLHFVVDDNTVVAQANGSSIVNDGNWHHVAITGDGTNWTFYVDGVAETPSFIQGDGTKWFNDAPGLTHYSIGALDRSTKGNFFDGDIGEVRIYPRALTAAQVFQNYNATKSKYTNEPPDTAPKIGPGIVYDSNLLLNYDFGNRATFDKNVTNVRTPFSMVESTAIEITPPPQVSFGNNSMAIGYGRLVVGREYANSGNDEVYIYDYSGNLIDTIAGPNASSAFGSSVAIGSDRIVVGARFGDVPSSLEAGWIKIFDLSGNELRKVNNPDPAYQDHFGYSVAVGGNRIVVGAYGDDDNGSITGSAYIFDLSGNYITKLVPSEINAIDFFGIQVYIFEEKIAIVSLNTGDLQNASVWLYDLDGNFIRQFLIVDPERGDAADRVDDLVIYKDKLIVGDSGGGADYDGRVYVYDLDGNLLKTLSSDNDQRYPAGNLYYEFGNSVSADVDSNIIAIGAWYSENALGSVYFYDDDFNYIGKFTNPNPAPEEYDFYGEVVKVGDGKIVIKATHDNQVSGDAKFRIYSLTYPLPTTVKNLSSSSYTGTINGATFNPAGYFVFNPSTTLQRISFSDAGLAVGTGDYSIEVWIQHTDLTGQQTYFTDAFGDGPGPYFAKKSDTAGGVVGLYYGGGWTLEGTTALLVNTWYHIVVSRSSGTTTLYVNATSEDSGSDNVSITNSDMDIGDSDTSSGQMKGYIGEVRFYNRALSSTEVSKNFNATRSKYGV